ncbi:P-type conjugative transfer protein TrbL [Aeromonas caviae]
MKKVHQKSGDAMRKYISLTTAMLFLSLSFNAYAEVNSAGLFDDVLERYGAAASSWGGVITDAATWLFWLLVTISMVWTFGMMALRKADIGEFFAEFVRFTIFTGFFWWLLSNGPNFASSIYDSMRQIAGNATGLGGSLSPSGIVDVGFEIFYTVMDQSSLWSPVDSVAGMLMAVAILIVLALVGVNMLLMLASGWVLAYGGVFFLGFGGSRWTSEMAINYYKTVLGVGAQLMAMVLLAGIGKTFLDDYYSRMSSSVNLKEMGVLLIVCVILLALVNKVPALIAGISSGATGAAGIGQMGAGAALGAAGMAAAAAATGGALMAAGAANATGGAQAVMAAFSKANENVSGGTDTLSSMFNGGGDSGNSGSGGTDGAEASTGSTPFSQAAGFSQGSGSTPADGDTSTGGGGEEASQSQGESQSGQQAQEDKSGSPGSMSAATRAARVAVDAGANLAKAAGQLAKDKASGMKDSAMERVSNTLGGRIAESIKSGSEKDPSFTGNSLGGDDSESEIAAFANKDSEVSEFANKKA